MNLDYYKEELSKLDKGSFDKVNDILDYACFDNDIDIADLDILNDIADDIYYER